MSTGESKTRRGRGEGAGARRQLPGARPESGWLGGAQTEHQPQGHLQTRPCPPLTQHKPVPRSPPHPDQWEDARKELVCPHLSLSLSCSWNGSPRALPVPTSHPKGRLRRQKQREDTSMRFTMLRQDSRLKPLVRRSLSARKTSPNTSTQPASWACPVLGTLVGQGSGRHHFCPLVCKI